MKLKKRIAVAFALVLIFPLVLTTIAFFVIFRQNYTSPNKNANFGESSISVAANPVEYANDVTREVFNELSLCIQKTPERLANAEYLDELNKKLAAYKSALVIEKNGVATYKGSESLYNKSKDMLDRVSTSVGNADSGNYFGNKGILVKKLSYTLTDGSVGSAFIITDISELVENSKKGLVTLIFCVILIMLATAGGLAIWLYRSILLPLNSLRASTKRMKSGDLDTPVKVTGNDEIGELASDFDDMRRHIKELLAENRRHEIDTKDLIVNISHDLKTPLTAIKGYSEGLLEGVANTPEKREKYVRTIFTKAGEMTTLVDELSTFAKIDTNSIPYHFKSINIFEYFEDGISDIKTDLELQNIELAFFPYADKTTDVIADPEQLTRVVNNIISNSVKYRNPAKVGLICIRLMDAEDFIRVEIEDNGKGIDRKSLPYIFERFYRADASRNSKTGGSGLGLAICKKIIEDGGGRIWAESTEGTGTTVIFMLRKNPNVSKDISENKDSGNAKGDNIE